MSHTGNMKQSIWHSSIWKELQTTAIVNILGVPDNISPEILSGKDVAIVHAADWSLYSLHEWTQIYSSYGAESSLNRQILLNQLLQTFHAYQEHELSLSMAKSLWLALWSTATVICIHPQWYNTHSILQQYLPILMDQTKDLPIKWVLCNSINTLGTSIEWRTLC